MSIRLEEHRKKASDLSLGSSHHKIYEKALLLLKSFEVKGRHLDFGSGRGTFLSLLQRDFDNLELTGMDLMAKPDFLDKKISWIQEDLNQNLKVPGEPFDSISALEIIEHLENPRHVLRELYQLLKKEGILILSTPNNESWRSMISYLRRGHFVAFTDRSYPAHITALNRKDLIRAAQEAGFEFLDWDFTHHGCVPGWTRLTWQSLSRGRLKGLRYSDNLFIVLKKG